MAEPLVHRETPVEYFRGLVERALEHQRLRASDATTFYVVKLLARFAESGQTGLDAEAAEPLAIRLANALQSGGAKQREGLRRVGDESLFLSGFFSDSLNRKLVDIDYYIALGGCAYGSLARCGKEARAEVFDELAGRFAGFVDVLAEVSERTSLTSNADLLRLYERWLRTGSRRNADILAERGIVPNASIGARFLQ